MERYVIKKATRKVPDRQNSHKYTPTACRRQGRTLMEMKKKPWSFSKRYSCLAKHEEQKSGVAEAQNLEKMVTNKSPILNWLLTLSWEDYALCINNSKLKYTRIPLECTLYIVHRLGRTHWTSFTQAWMNCVCVCIARTETAYHRAMSKQLFLHVDI